MVKRRRIPSKRGKGARSASNVESNAQEEIKRLRNEARNLKIQLSKAVTSKEKLSKKIKESKAQKQKKPKKRRTKKDRSKSAKKGWTTRSGVQHFGEKKWKILQYGEEFIENMRNANPDPDVWYLHIAKVLDISAHEAYTLFVSPEH